MMTVIKRIQNWLGFKYQLNKQRLIVMYCRFLNFLHGPLRSSSDNDPYHVVMRQFLEYAKEFNEPTVLEIGSRDVSGITRRSLVPNNGRFVGFDYHPGDGVDVVGDAHKLSDYFQKKEFDLVFSISVFEHILFPWKVVLEINKVLKTGGYVFLTTHPAWPEHEMPWDFWRFPANGFHALFNKYTGFELIMVTEGIPCKPYSLSTDIITKPLYRYTLNQGVAVLAKKIDDYNDDLIRWDVDISEITDSIYPTKEESQKVTS